MELKNYTKTAKFQMLFVAMGIKKLTNPPEVKFQKEIITEVKREYVDPQDKELLDRLNIGGMSFDFKDINVADDEPLEINNHKICVYIRDQKRNVDIYAKKSKYRYHLCNCRTLQGMRRLGRHHRYVATRRKDGYFEVVDLGSYQKLNGIIKLKLCMNCIEILQRKGMYNNPFSLSKYYEKYDSDVPNTITKIEKVTTINTYQPDWNDISREYRKASGYRCSCCGVDCSEKHELLHLHHMDGNKTNNERYNLFVLCADCHSHQPLHSQMRTNPKHREQIEQVKLLRIEQGISL